MNEMQRQIAVYADANAADRDLIKEVLSWDAPAEKKLAAISAVAQTALSRECGHLLMLAMFAMAVDDDDDEPSVELKPESLQ